MLTRLENVLKTSLQDVLRTCWQEVLKTSWRRLEDLWPHEYIWRLLKTPWSIGLEDLLKKYSEDQGERRLPDVFIKANVCWVAQKNFELFLISKISKNSFLQFLFKLTTKLRCFLYFIKGTLMQIWKSRYMCVFILKQYPENFTFPILRILELIAREVCKFLKI